LIFLGLALRYVLGFLREDKDLLDLHSSEVKIHTAHKRLRVALDGEITIMQPPLDYRVRSRALRVIVPKDAE
jgi:diacylglycerol kinase family enzyme